VCVLEGFQVSPACPSDSTSIKMHEKANKGHGILISH
jgi:hypothetical protein